MVSFARRWYAAHVPMFFNASVSLQLKSQLQPAQYYATPAITRYFDHIQTLPSVRAAAQALSPAFTIVPFDFESAPNIERKQEPPKKKEKTPKTVDQRETGKKTAIPANSKENAGEPPKEKKEKKEKKKDAVAAEDGSKRNKGGADGGGKAPAEDASEPVPSMIDLRVGHIIDGMISSDFLPALTVLY
jgi:aminoacyl tRNA synthase complex-interacting multifunctional protein 1